MGGRKLPDKISADRESKTVSGGQKSSMGTKKSSEETLKQKNVEIIHFYNAFFSLMAEPISTRKTPFCRAENSLQNSLSVKVEKKKFHTEISPKFRGNFPNLVNTKEDY